MVLRALAPDLGRGEPSRRVKSAVRGIIELEIEFNTRSRPLDESAMRRLYERLRGVYGIGDKTAHLIIYDLIRLHGFPVFEELGPHRELIEKLRLLGISEPEKLFKPKDWPYVDAALWDL